MKPINELTKSELLSLIINLPPGKINIFDKLAECAVCGDNPSAEYYYVCTTCEENLVDKHDK